MGCSQLHFDVAVTDNYTVGTEPQTVTLMKMSAVHVMHGDPCTAPVDICVERVVKCQKGCMFETFLHDFPIDPCEPILPPGTYQISTREGQMLSLESGVVSVDIVFEEVSAEYVQAIIANKGAGCEN